MIYMQEEDNRWSNSMERLAVLDEVSKAFESLELKGKKKFTNEVIYRGSIVARLETTAPSLNIPI